MVSQPWLWQPWLYTELRAWAAGSPAVVDPALLLVIDSATSDHLHQQMAAAGLSQGAETLAWSVGGAKDSPINESLVKVGRPQIGSIAICGAV